MDPRRLHIIRFPDPVLKKPAKPVEHFGDPVAALAERMLALMREAKGVGLAGPQVGQSVRVFVCNPTGDPADDLICLNPILLDLTGAEVREEGCLSIPEVSVHMRRATHATLRAYDVHGRPFTREGTDLLARIWQHELDHLDGRLITDHMSTADEIANRKAIRKLQDDYRKAKGRR